MKNDQTKITVIQPEEFDSIIDGLDNGYNGELSIKQPVSIITGKLEEAIDQVEDIFYFVKRHTMLPLAEIKQTVIPIIQTASEIPQFFYLFYQLQSADDYTYRHNIGVGVIATLIGKWLSLSDEDLSALTIAATLHDIGKTKIPTEILNKPGKLTKDEYEIVKKHTMYGYEILKNTDGISHEISLVALQHHEREDGKGYPFGLKGSKISYLSKIVAVADVFHAMSSNRVYHDATPFYQVIKQMNDDMFGKLDPTILVPFLQQIMNALIGHHVLLTDGQIGKIKYINPYDLLNPLVEVSNTIIDLSVQKTIQIERVLAD
ncbi:HD-GYP domain-containing protein [Fredinandcohnia sp. QZ13]|uniref:HD-GYP domain-containing protein n=1 Tax=Fredinandcohnia sp. QZ13 TaxID=3073144 RepID=UPI002852F601|nr:HD-GYP domain-containing protein [Fredinandcohnia sp. QZ13]MDR4888630.1 HD-GYP domain-containing protein [Fredinandcohnia sp. QZ13]